MNMQKTALASAVALGMGLASNADALNVKIHNMNFGANYLSSGDLFDTTGNLTSTAGNYGFMESVVTFNKHHWSADAVVYFDAHSEPLSWAGTGTGVNPYGAPTLKNFSYTFHLTDYQVAWGLLFNWNGINGIPVLNIMDCGVGGDTGQNGDNCYTIPTAMANGPFSGSEAAWTGDIHSGSVPFSGNNAVPIPAAAWLFGSGLVGLAGIGRRRKKG